MRMQQMQAQMQIDAMLLQQMHTQLGVAPLAAPQVEQEAMCVVCMDERKQHAMVPCMHMCVCEACAQRLLDARICGRGARDSRYLRFGSTAAMQEQLSSRRVL
jgi:hypothetical protein